MIDYADAADNLRKERRENGESPSRVPDHRVYAYYKRYRGVHEGAFSGQKGEFWLSMARRFRMPVQSCKDAVHREQIRLGRVPDEPRVMRRPCVDCEHRGGWYRWFQVRTEQGWLWREEYRQCPTCKGQRWLPEVLDEETPTEV